MIVGIGTDIIEIQRIEEAMQNSNLLARCFTENERAYFLAQNNRPEVVAGNFAAKEAFSKALGTGIRGFSMHQVEILRDELGKPYVRVLFPCEAADTFWVTISHSKAYATATVLAEKR